MLKLGDFGPTGLVVGQSGWEAQNRENPTRSGDITCMLLLSYLWSYIPLIIFHTISCPLYNLKTVRDISMKRGTLIKQNDRI